MINRNALVCWACPHTQVGDAQPIGLRLAPGFMPRRLSEAHVQKFVVTCCVCLAAQVNEGEGGGS